MHDLKTTEESLDSLEWRIAALERLDIIDDRFDEITRRIDRRFDEIKRLQFDNLERRIAVLEAKAGSAS